ncbi:MAG: histidine kinase [Candidatus Limnocylindrales bacterium]
MTIDPRRLFLPGILVLTAIATAIPLAVDGWWLDLGMSGRVALSVSCLVSVGAGLIARSRRPGNPIGTWLMVSGMSAPLGFIVGSASPLITLASGAMFLLAAGSGAAIPISFPSGKLDGRAPAAIAAVVFTCAVYRAQQVVLFDPVKSIPGWAQPNPFFVDASQGARDAFAVAYSVFGLAFLLVFGFWLARRWWRLSGPARLSIAPVLAGALLFVATSVVQGVASSAGVTGQAMDAVQLVHTLSYGAVPLGILAGLLRVRMARSAIADLVVELGETPDPAELRRALATALGDPTLEVVLWSAELAAFVDASLAPVASLEAVAGSRAITLLERDGTPLAAILHDPALLEDPGLVASVATAVRLTVENDRLQAEVRAQLAEVRASRARIVEATDAERRRIERDIHDGAQQRLVALSLAIGRARGQLGPAADPELEATLAQASDEVRSALAELRELARGIHPAILTQAGLEPAVRSLVDRAAVPTDIEFAVEHPLPEPVEAAAYFVVSEALTNVVKHAAAGAARVALRTQDGTLVVEIRDDGCGGADPGRGSGLRGLRDRVEAVGGTLETMSPAGAGTTVRATLPIRDSE